MHPWWYLQCFDVAFVAPFQKWISLQLILLYFDQPYRSRLSIKYLIFYILSLRSTISRINRYIRSFYRQIAGNIQSKQFPFILVIMTAFCSSYCGIFLPLVYDTECLVVEYLFLGLPFPIPWDSYLPSVTNLLLILQ